MVERRMPLTGAPVRRRPVIGRSRSRRVWDFAQYTVIAIGLVAAAGAFGVHQARSGGSPVLPIKWIGFGGLTAIVFGYGIREHARLWGERRFWVIMSTVLLAHVVLGFLILQKFEVVPLLALGPVAGLEFGALALCLSAAFPDAPTDHSQPRHVRPKRDA